MSAKDATAASNGPFHPAEWHPKQKKSAKVRDHESPSAVLRCQTGKTQEVSKTYCAAGDSQHSTQLGIPCDLNAVIF